jgi:prophage regulatory protein
MSENLKVLRRKAVVERTGYSAMHIYRLEREGKFPKRIQLGPNAVGWIEHEVDAWIESKMAQRENAA